MSPCRCPAAAGWVPVLVTLFYVFVWVQVSNPATATSKCAQSRSCYSGGCRFPAVRMHPSVLPR